MKQVTLGVLCMALAVGLNSSSCVLPQPNTSHKTAILRPYGITCNAEVKARFVEAGIAEEEVLRANTEVGLKLEYVIKSPTKMRINFKSYTPPKVPWPNLFSSLPGSALIMSDNKLAVVPPKKPPIVWNIDQATSEGNKLAIRRSAELPLIAPLVSDMVKVSSTDWSKAIRKDDQILSGIKCQVYELIYNKPIKIAEPHTVSTAYRYIDVNRDVVLKEEYFDTKNVSVSTISYRDFKKTSEGRWVPLKSSSVISPGWIILIADNPQKQTPANASQVKNNAIQRRTQIPGRQIERTYEIVDDKYPLLSTINITNDDGRLILSASFRDYKVNVTIPDSLFEISAP